MARLLSKCINVLTIYTVDVKVMARSTGVSRVPPSAVYQTYRDGAGRGLRRCYIALWRVGWVWFDTAH